LGTPANGEAATSGNGTNFARLAQNCERADSFYATALAAGAVGEGAPELRDVDSHFCAAYVRARDDRKSALVCHQDPTIFSFLKFLKGRARALFS